MVYTSVITPEHRRAFERFCAAAEELAASRFVRDVAPGRGKLVWTLERGWDFPKEDLDDLRSALVLMRKFYLDREPTNVRFVLRSLGQYTRAEHRPNLREAHGTLEKLADSYRGINLFVGPQDLMNELAAVKAGEEVPAHLRAHLLKPADLMDALWNGWFVHEDERLDQRIELIKFLRDGIFKFAMIHVLDVSAFMSGLAAAIRTGGFLDPND